MAVHFLHIGKTGGTAIKWALNHADSSDTQRTFAKLMGKSEAASRREWME